MPKQPTVTDLPRNKQGGLNLNWAITQALAKLGDKAKIADVKKFIVTNYKKLGKDACENVGSLSTGISSMRKKLREESKKVPPVPVSTNGVPAPSAKSRPDQTPVATASVTPAAFGIYIKTTLKPAMTIVDKALDATNGNIAALKQAIAEVESAQKVFGDNLVAVVTSVD